ncbi:polyamine-modulated factor 1 [Python bivittatus]|uniref:Polyamine-modulated factor 1 n=1 Tax=Python bivittatus TaxID=176946 RepID=A0A9F5JB81_PYTBI|nr:polyamine-modulated factor 1 [Python bivittatus]
MAGSVNDGRAIGVFESFGVSGAPGQSLALKVRAGVGFIRIQFFPRPSDVAMYRRCILTVCDLLQFFVFCSTIWCRLFTKCYSRLYKAQPEFTKCVYNQFVSHLQKSVLEEIQALKQEGNLQVLFESLDKLEKGAKDKEACAWRPSGIPEEDTRGVVVPYLLKQRKFLQKALKEKQEGNCRLAAAVVAGRERISELQQQIHKQKEDWQGIATDGRKMMKTFDELP